MSQNKRTERYYYQSGTMEKPNSGHARGFPERWMAEQYLDEEREHSVVAARHSDNTQVVSVVDYSAPYRPRVVYAEYIHGSKPQSLRLPYGDYDVVVDVALVDNIPAIIGGVFDDCYHRTNEPLTCTDIDNVGERYQVEVEAYHKSLEFPGRAVFETERPAFVRTDRPTLAAKKERA